MDDRVNEVHAVKCELASEVLLSSGKLRLRVTGWSMLPSVWPGDTLLVERIGAEEAREGDIVLFGRGRRLIAHRVAAKAGGSGSATITRGDGMPHPDSPVSDADLLGKVSFIVRNGRFIRPSKSLKRPEHAVAAFVRRSRSAARIIVGVHNFRKLSRDRGEPCQS
jgi:signal peptidase I